MGEVYDSSVRLMLTFTVEGGNADDRDQAYDECYEEHLATIERDWFHANVPTGAERDAIFEDLIACLKENGVSGVTVGMEQQEIIDAIVAEVVSDDSRFAASLFCMDEHAALFPDEMYPSQ
ncbi:MAG: hypothetical protein LBS27_09615 [Bifidobacteriaceae bacterium]|nr:hypothetical protein [Bifidobacteriaceae bacterium]